jgi:hypothetical protein
MTDTPEDVPSAVRAAFSSHRTASAWNLVCSAEPNVRMAALLGFERLLNARGLELSDIAVAIAALPAPDPPVTAPPTTTDPSGFGGSFSRTAGRRMSEEHAQASRTDTGSTTGKQIIRGLEVPDTVIGRIRVQERRPSDASGTMLVFLAETESRVFGPIAAYAGPQIAHLLEAERSNWIIRMLVERTHSDRILPKVRRIETV